MDTCVRVSECVSRQNHATRMLRRSPILPMQGQLHVIAAFARDIIHRSREGSMSSAGSGNMKQPNRERHVDNPERTGWLPPILFRRQWITQGGRHILAMTSVTTEHTDRCSTPSSL